MMFALFQNFRGGEILVILGVALLLFGAKRLPEIGRGMGKGIREFRDATKGLADDVRTGMEDEEQDQTPERTTKDQ